MRIFVLIFSLSILVFNTPLFGQQQPISTDLRSRTKLQQPVRTVRIPDNLIQIQLVTVPLLVGRKYNSDEIVPLLNRVGLQLGKAVPVANNEKIGLVISQSPGVRQRVRPQTPIDITYGVEVPQIPPGLPKNVIVPNYVGMNIDRVLVRISNDSLTPGLQNEILSERPTGEVVEQFPPPDSEVDPGTRVNLSFSSGPQPEILIEVPPLIGFTLQEAAIVLRKKQLFAGQLKEQVSDKREGEVLEQSPPVGTMVPKGSTVDITYSVQVHEEFVLVPDVTNMFIDKAIIVLKESRLNYSVEYNKRSDLPKGKVLLQEPLPETRIPVGSDVHLVIANSQQFPPWIYWVCGIVASVLVGGFIGWKSGKGQRRNKTSGNKDPELQLVKMPDGGKQTIRHSETGKPMQGLQLKIVPDKGVQTIKTN